MPRIGLPLACLWIAAVGCSGAGPGADASSGPDGRSHGDAAADATIDHVPSPGDAAVDQMLEDDVVQPSGDASPIRDGASVAEEDDGGAVDAATDGGADAASSSPFRIYLAPNGNDRNSGTAPTRPVLTLQRAHDLVAAARPARDVDVVIAPGMYFAQRVVWTYVVRGHSITFAPPAPDAPMPVFDGCTSATPSDVRTGCPGGTWFTLQHSGGLATGLQFRRLRVQRYQTAISFNGSRGAEATSNGSNGIHGCYFSQIGNGWAPHLAGSTACVRLVNSDDNVIARNAFVNVTNTRETAGLIHALYIAHRSDRNRIEDNQFRVISGDPIRLRDYSNGNVIRRNRLTRAGRAGYSEWYCDHAVRSDCTSANPECPSWNNQFRDNVLDGTYDCDPLSTFVFYQDDQTAGCTRPSPTSVRLRTSGNTRTATPCSLR